MQKEVSSHMILTQTFTYDEICQNLHTLSAEYKDFTTLRIVGTSHDQRDILMFRVGLGMESMVLSAGLYGRDSMNPLVFLQLAQEYCRAYLEDETIGNYHVRQLLNRCSICFVPLVNPDGYEISRCGYDAIRNPVLRQFCKIREIDYKQWRFNAKGIDINGNFPCKSYIQQQLGEYPASEPETRALMKVFEEYDTVGYLNFQSRGRITYYFRQALPFAYNQKYHRMARFMQKMSDCCIGRKEGESTYKATGGTPINYYSELMKKPALTIETLEPALEEAPLNPECFKETYKEVRILPLKIIQKL